MSDRHQFDGGGLVAAEGFYEQGGEPPAPARPPVTVNATFRLHGDCDRMAIQAFVVRLESIGPEDPRVEDPVLETIVTVTMEEESWPTA